jgi:hypothetical protein
LLRKPAYWVCSKEINEISGFGHRPVPARFDTFEEAKQYRLALNLRRGPYHPGYIIKKEEDSPPPSPLILRKIVMIES